MILLELPAYVIAVCHSYGLAAAVLSKDLDRCERMTKVKIWVFCLCFWFFWTTNLKENCFMVYSVLSFTYLLLYL